MQEARCVSNTQWLVKKTSWGPEATGPREGSSRVVEGAFELGFRGARCAEMEGGGRPSQGRDKEKSLAAHPGHPWTVGTTCFDHVRRQGHCCFLRKNVPELEESWPGARTAGLNPGAHRITWAITAPLCLIALKDGRPVVSWGLGAPRSICEQQSAGPT